MKKLIKNYLTKLQENNKKGFSLVELIIVMAIMAVLVGVVASQVLPYMEKSRISKDQENLASIQMDISSAIAMSGEACAATASNNTAVIEDLGTITNAATVTEFQELRGITQMLKTADLKFKSKKADGADVYVKVDESTGEITVFLSADSGTSAVDPKLSVSSASSTSSSN